MLLLLLKRPVLRWGEVSWSASANFNLYFYSTHRESNQHNTSCIINNRFPESVKQDQDKRCLKCFSLFTRSDGDRQGPRDHQNRSHFTTSAKGKKFSEWQRETVAHGAQSYSLVFTFNNHTESAAAAINHRPHLIDWSLISTFAASSSSSCPSCYVVLEMRSPPPPHTTEMAKKECKFC